MGNGCAEVGLTPKVIKRYVEVARDRYLPSNEAPLGMTREEMRAHMDAVEQRADQVCTNPQLAAKAAMVLGHLTEAESIDSQIPLAERHRRVQEDYRRFRALVALGNQDESQWKKLSAFQADVDFVTDQYFARHVTNKDPIPSDQPALLQRTLDEIRRVKGGRVQPVVVFDLDDTLFNPATRSVRILREYADQHPEMLSPTDLAIIHSITAEQLVYDVPTDLQARWNISDATFLNGLREYWFSKFFTNEYAAQDTAHPGAPEYVSAVAKAGAMVVYFTGRQETGQKAGTEGGMRQGTLEALSRNGFPSPNGESVRLFMKPAFEMPDMEYKQGVLAQISALGTVVAAFDNEPKADAMFVKQWPGAHVVRIGRCRSPNPSVVRAPDGKETPVVLQNIFRLPAGVLWIQDYRMNGRQWAMQ